MCLLLGATGVGKSLLVKRLQKLSSQNGKGDLGDPPPTRPTVGTDLTDLTAHGKITIRELGGCMGPIWSSYYGNCRSLLFMVDTSNPTQLSASCAQLLGLLSAEPLAEAAVLVLFNKTDLPCYMTMEEMKSLIRLPDIIACAKQNVTVAEGLPQILGALEICNYICKDHFRKLHFMFWRLQLGRIFWGPLSDLLCWTPRLGFE